MLQGASASTVSCSSAHLYCKREGIVPRTFIYFKLNVIAYQGNFRGMGKERGKREGM
jgi:hypothetical protein